MTDEQLDAIRVRSEENYYRVRFPRRARQDITALLGEVERLREVVQKYDDDIGPFGYAGRI